MIRLTSRVGRPVLPCLHLQAPNGSLSTIPSTVSSDNFTHIKPPYGSETVTELPNAKGLCTSSKTTSDDESKDVQCSRNDCNGHDVDMKTKSSAIGIQKLKYDHHNCVTNLRKVLSFKPTGLLQKQSLKIIPPKSSRKAVIHCSRHKCTSTHDSNETGKMQDDVPLDVPSFFDQTIVTDEEKADGTSNHSNTEDGDLVPPDPETCCGSGCVNCVYIKYVQDVLKRDPNDRGKVKEVLEEIEDFNVRMFIKMELGL